MLSRLRGYNEGPMILRPLFSFALAAAFLAAAPALAPPQPFPTRAVRVVLPTSPGGATDAFTRALSPRLSASWVQPVMVENRPGGNPILGTDAVPKPAP